MSPRVLLLLLAAMAATSPAWPAVAPRPNIVFILTDDLGPGDIGILYQNSRNFATNRNLPAFVTPKLDTFANEGARLTRHYCPAPVCAPSRASLLLGVHQGHCNVRDNQFDKALEANHTLASVLKQAGYATAAIGKWGLAGSSPYAGHPLNRGFDSFFGYLAHEDGHHHYPKEGGRALYDGFSDVSSGLDKCYTTDLWTARAKKWINEQHAADPAKPFFLYLAYDTPHAQLNVPTVAYPAGGGLTGGIQWTGTSGAMINTASGTIDTWIHPDYASATYDNDSNSSTAEVAWPDYAKRHATMIRRLDDAVGDLVQLLQDLSIDNNTLIIFTSDNGAHNEAGSGGSYIYNPTFFDSFANFDGIKRDLWEGGVRMATLARWPGTVPAGRVSGTPSQFHDWLPTFCDLAGVLPPARSDGVSIVSDLTGAGGRLPSLVYSEYYYSGTTPNYSEFETAHRNATRSQMQMAEIGNYKGVRYNIASQATDFLIYDVVNDPKETTNRAGQAGVPTQQEFKDLVLRARRAGGGVSRPYDNDPVPAVTPTVTVAPGLDFRAFEGSYAWVPNFATAAAAATGSVTQPDLSVRTRENDVGLEFSGWIQIPAAGNWTLTLDTDTGAFVRLHDAQLIDDDRAYASGGVSSGAIPLTAGLHPVRVSYRHTNAAAHTLTLQWSGPGVTQQAVPASAFFHAAPAIPHAANDSAHAMSGTPTLFDVLANDSDDGLPQPLSIVSVTTPDHGTAAIQSNKVLYTPPAGFAGTATFSYTITDGENTATATVTVSVSDYSPPTARNDLLYAAPGAGTVLSVLANDSDDGSPGALSLAAVSTPTAGTAVIQGAGILFTAPAGFNGSSSFTYTISDGGPVTSTATVTVVVSPASDYWFPLDESGGLTATDAAGRPAALVNFAANPAQWVTGKLSRALSFDGTDDYVQITGFTGILGTGARTVCAWVKTSGAGQYPVIAWGPNTAGQKWTFLVQSGNVRIEVTSGYRQGSKVVNDNAWHHVAATFANDGTPDATDVVLYVDGVAETTFNASLARAISTTASLDVRIGSDVQDRRFLGQIDDARIYSRALSAAEIAALAAATGDGNLRSLWHFQQTGNANPTTADWNRDDENDGLTRYAEFALGGSPNWTDTTILPVLVRDSGVFQFVFNRRLTGIAASSYIVETTQGLAPPAWTTLAGGTAVVHPDLAGFERVTVPLPADNAPRRFVRLRVQ